VTVRGLEIEATLALRLQTLLVRHLDRLAEMGDRLLDAERRSAWSPALPHHSIARSSSPGWVK
jgi:hypothetical protein